MWILFRKKSIYHFLCAIAIVVICMLGSLRVIDGKDCSVFDVIWKLPKEVRRTCSIQEAFDAGVSGWIYILMPLIVSVPSASLILDELKSKFYLYIQSREGRFKYLYSRFFLAMLASGGIVFAGIGIYSLIICCFFPLHPIYAGIQTVGLVEISGYGLLKHMSVKFLYMMLYSAAVSLFTSFLVFLYANLYFDLSVVFITNYVLQALFVKDRIHYPIIIIMALFILYGFMWRFRSRRI